MLKDSTVNGQKIRFTYSYANEYIPKYANGTIGSFTPDGEFVIEFYLERPKPIDKQEFYLENNGHLGEAIDDESDNGYLEITRHIVTGVILHQDTAMELYKLISKQLAVVEQKEDR
jgi:hypothetical protein